MENIERIYFIKTVILYVSLGLSALALLFMLGCNIAQSLRIRRARKRLDDMMKGSKDK